MFKMVYMWKPDRIVRNTKTHITLVTTDYIRVNQKINRWCDKLVRI